MMGFNSDQSEALCGKTEEKDDDFNFDLDKLQASKAIMDIFLNNEVSQNNYAWRFRSVLKITQIEL